MNIINKTDTYNNEVRSRTDNVLSGFIQLTLQYISTSAPGWLAYCSALIWRSREGCVINVQCSDVRKTAENRS